VGAREGTTGKRWQRCTSHASNAEDRIYRIGQTRPAFVTYLYAKNTLDDFVAALLEARARDIRVLEAEAAWMASPNAAAPASSTAATAYTRSKWRHRLPPAR
jgi:hypothetical protein